MKGSPIRYLVIVIITIFTLSCKDDAVQPSSDQTAKSLKKNGILGKWIGERETFDFSSDGSVVMIRSTVKGGSVEIHGSWATNDKGEITLTLHYGKTNFSRVFTHVEIVEKYGFEVLKLSESGNQEFLMAREGFREKLALVKAEKITRVRLAKIRLTLEEYAAENNGIYPSSKGMSSEILYQAFSGDPTGKGHPPTQVIYWPQLLDDRGSNLVGVFQGNRVILDGYGRPFRYRAAIDENGDPVSDIRSSGDYDLWSVGPDGLPAEIDVSGTLITEETQDDIWE